MSYHYLTMAGRNVVHNLQNFDQSQAKIARCLGRSPTTTSRELKRNPNSSGQYLPDIAQIKANDDANAMHCLYDAWNRLAGIHWDDGDPGAPGRATYRSDPALPEWLRGTGSLNRRVRKFVVGDDANTTTQHMYHNTGHGLRSLGGAGWQIVEARRAVNADPATEPENRRFFTFSLPYPPAGLTWW